MSAQEKQNLCMSTREEYEKIAVMINPGASETVASEERFESYPIEKTTASGTTYQQLGSKQKICQRWSEIHSSRRRHGTESWAKFQTRSTQDAGKGLQIGGIWTLGGVQPSRPGELHTKQLQRLQDVFAVAQRVLLP